MTEKIGQLWQEGETHVKAGSIHEGIIFFLKAKYHLNNEKAFIQTVSSNNKSSEIITTLFIKLDESIEKNAIILEKNPILALRLPLRFTKGDLKKFYRKSALKYHPDKNNDCDTSRLFTIIQSAYEKLEPIAPDGPATTSKNDEKEQLKTKNTKSKTYSDTNDLYKNHSGSADDLKERRQQYWKKEYQHQRNEDHNKEYNSYEGQEQKQKQEQEERLRQQQKQQEEQQRQKEQKRQEEEQKHEKQKQQEEQQRQQQKQQEEQHRKQKQEELKRKQASSQPISRYPDPSDLSTEELREVVRKFGVCILFFKIYNPNRNINIFSFWVQIQ